MVGKPLSLPKAMIQKNLLLCSIFLSWPLLSKPKEIEKTSSWPQWRGPDRNGIISKDSAWPNKINKETLTEKWRVSLGKGYSGPVVSQNLVFHHRISRRIRIDPCLQSRRWQTCMANPMGGKNESPLFCCEKW